MLTVDIVDMESDNTKFKILLIVLLTTVTTISALSVTGLLQSTEKISSTGIIIKSSPIVINGSISPGSIYPPPPEPAIEIDVYSDSACTKKVTDIRWREIEAGNKKYRTIFVKNQGDIGVVLSLLTENWSPSNSEEYMDLKWNYDGSSIAVGEVKRITLSLKVDASCPEINEFNFRIVIIAS